MNINVAMILSTVMVLQCLVVMAWSALHGTFLSFAAGFTDFSLSFYIVGILLPAKEE